MKRFPEIHGALAAIAVMVAAVMSGCSSDTTTGANQSSDNLTASPGEHDRDGDGEEHDGESRGEHARDRDGNHGEEGEESGTELALTDSYDKVRNGARLVLAYDAQSNSFNGTVENTTDKTLERVRVEVHLSNGKELGPTTPADLEPGEKRDVKLTPTGKGFDGWTAHPEVGNEEHGHGDEHREGNGEHGQEARGEHDRDGSEHGGKGRGEHKEGASD